MNSKDIVSKIASLRERASLTQLELSQKVGVTETTIANWEKGRSSLDWIERVIRLCEALQCIPKDLIEYREQAQNPMQAEPVPSLSVVHEYLGVDQLTNSEPALNNCMNSEQANVTDYQETHLPG